MAVAGCAWLSRKVADPSKAFQLKMITKIEGIFTYRPFLAILVMLVKTDTEENPRRDLRTLSNALGLRYTYFEGSFDCYFNVCSDFPSKA